MARNEIRTVRHPARGGRAASIGSLPVMILGITACDPTFEAATDRAALDAEYGEAEFVAASSANFTNASRMAADVDLIVVHTVEGSYRAAITWFQNPEANVSAHYVIRRDDGAITQMVAHEDIAWHAGNRGYNARSIGIEHEGFVTDPDNYTIEMYTSSARLVRFLADSLGIPKDRAHIIGHEEVPGATHTDPGPFWDWDLYLSLINATDESGTLKGIVHVEGDSSRRIAGAEITVWPAARTSISNANGYYQLELPAGDYRIEASAEGYAHASIDRALERGVGSPGTELEFAL